MSQQLVYNAETCEYEPIDLSGSVPEKARTKQESTKVKLYEYLMFGILKRGSIIDKIELNAEIVGIIRSFSVGTRKDIDFLVKTIIKSCTKWNTKNSIAILALVILSASPKTYAKEKFLQIFKDVVKTDDDLIEFMELIKTDSIRGFGKIIQKAIQKWFNDLSPYEALKIKRRQVRTPRQTANGAEYTISDILRLAHVKPKDDEQSSLYKWLLTGEFDSKIHQSIKASEWYKKTTTLSPQKREITKNNNIPVEVLKPIKSPVDAYINILPQLSFNDLLRNFTLLSEKGVFLNESAKKHVIKVFKSKQIINRSGALPHQFFELYDQNTSASIEILAALETAAENAYVNLPKINKKITIFVDRSGTAKSSFASDSTKVPLHYTFATFSSIIAKISKSTDIYTFSKDVVKQDFNSKENTLEISDSIIDKKTTSHSTNNVELFKFLSESNIKSDILIFFSASLRWEEVLRGTDSGSYLTNYMNRIGGETQRIIFVNSNNQGVMFDHTLRLTDFIHGWNERNLKYLLYLLQADYTKIDDII